MRAVLVSTLVAAMTAAAAAQAAPPPSKKGARAPAAAPAEAAPAATQPAPPPAQPAPPPAPAGKGDLLAVQLAQLANLSAADAIEVFGYYDRDAKRVVLALMGPARDADRARREIDEFRGSVGPVLADFVKAQHGMDLTDRDISLRYTSRTTRQDLARWENGSYVQ